MKTAEEILRMLDEGKPFIAAVTEASNLYTDLGYDSLGFAKLLVQIEEAYSIRFALPEMSECIQADRLIALVEQKVKEHDETPAGWSKSLGSTGRN